MGLLIYPAEVSFDSSDGVWRVDFPDLFAATTEAATKDEALSEAQGCLTAGIVGHMATGRDLPKPSAARGRPLVAPDAVVAAKATLWQAMRDDGVGNSALAKRLGVTESAVRHLLDPTRNSRIDRIEAALAALGKRMAIGLTAA